MKKKKEKRTSKKEVAKVATKRNLIPFTAGKLPCVSRAMPMAASIISSVSKELPSVAKPLPQVSAKPNMTISKYWGTMPKVKKSKGR